MNALNVAQLHDRQQHRNNVTSVRVLTQHQVSLQLSLYSRACCFVHGKKYTWHNYYSSRTLCLV